MDKEVFDRLPEHKKQILEKAYFSAYNKDITPSDFFNICKKTLTEAEYNALFHEFGSENEQKEQQQTEEIKTEHIEDIIQYSGIDLKEEADNMNKLAEKNIGYGQYENVEDKNSKIESLFNPQAFQDFIVKICSQRHLKITSEGIYLMFQIMKRKILDFTERMDAASKIRAEANLSEFNFKIDNEVCKQLWYLNEMEKVKLEKLMIKKEEDPKKKKVIQEREDLLIKKRQSSNVAMAAMGIEQKSWMTGDGLKANEDNSKFTPIYSPFDEKGFEQKIKGRSISMKDFIYVIERDKRYNKSIFLIQHYFK